MNRHLYQSIYKKLPALLILFLIYTAVMPDTASAQNSPVAKNEAENQDFFGERFREGRDLIDEQEWGRAAEKFREVVEKYPDHKLADAALYWLAFCYKKQKQYKEADFALARLLEKFPDSAWTGDAQVMKTEIAPLVGRLGVLGNANAGVAQGQFSSDLQADIVKGTVNGAVQNPSLAEKLAMSDRLPLDRADEIKLAAFQSLLNADPKRAVETMGEVLTPDSKASETLKREILRVWRNPRLFASNPLTSNIAKNTGGGKEFVALLRETLVKGFQNEKNLKIRIEIIYTLASLSDRQSLESLKRFYAAETDRDIKKDIINSFGISATEFSKFDSDSFPGQQTGFNISREQKRNMQIEILLEIVRSEKDIELRRLAFSNLRRFQGWAASGQAVETMTRLYDDESDEEFKISLIRAFAESKEAAAAKKLLEIARNEKSGKVKLEAIYALRTSTDPDVLKFLENLIK